jgi:polyhydroxyalkanoate depolymerase
MLYHFYEWNHAAIAPLRAFADAAKMFYQHPLNPIAHTEGGRTFAAMAEVFERSTRVYGKPEFGIHETVVNGVRVPVVDKPVWQKPFARLLHFERQLPAKHKADPRFLIVAPMSGHYATLLRGTVEALLPYADVYIADWEDARTVPLAMGSFDLDDYVDYVIEMLHFLGPDTHVMAVCQPAVPVLMAVAVMEAEDDPCHPATMTLMGGPIDTRINPTVVNKLAMDKGIGWFRDNVIMKVPFPHAGFLRDVYPGFLQLSGFMSMNLDRHVDAHKEFFGHLVKDDGDSAEKHREFYDEYMAVMDLTAEFYLQTVENVFITHALPKGEMMHRGSRVDLTAIKRTALLTVEGENDDISGVGQTQAAQTLCTGIPEDMRVHYLQPKVGHYGVFNGSRYRAEIAPRIIDFALTHGTTHAAAALPKKSAASLARSAEIAASASVEDPMAMSRDVKAQNRAAPASRADEPAAAPAETPAASPVSIEKTAVANPVAAPAKLPATVAKPRKPAMATTKPTVPSAKPASAAAPDRPKAAPPVAVATPAVATPIAAAPVDAAPMAAGPVAAKPTAAVTAVPTLTETPAAGTPLVLETGGSKVLTAAARTAKVPSRTSPSSRGRRKP